jgi:ABC-type uncharacterized transport system involved in gliding motility auxiliary subunit
MVARILNVISWIGVALVVAALAIFVTRPELGQYAKYMAWTGLVFVLLYPIVMWREIAGQFRRRQSKYAALASASVIIVLGLLVAINYLSNRRSKRWDLTANSVHTLSEQSQKVVKGLKTPLKLILIDRTTAFDQYRDRLSQYDYASDNVSVEYLDAEKDPVRVKQYGIQSVPTIVIEHEGRTEKVTTVDEREITSAIIRAATGQQRKLYFVQGHGEKDPAGTDTAGYGGVGQLMKGDNIGVEPLLLTQHKDVPDDATLIAVVGPTTDPFDEEIEQLKRYLAKGGKLLLMLDPAIGERAQPLTKLTALAHEWGLDVGNDVILDVSGRTQNPSYVVGATPYPMHPITEGFRVNTVFPLARSVTPIMPAPEGKTVQPLVQTAQQAWAETDLAGLQAGKTEPEMNPEKGDKPGPVGLAATVTTAAPPAPDPDKKDTPPATPQTRIAVFGDSDFASNAVGNSGGNADLFLNTVNWLMAQENLISIRPREPGDSRLSIEPFQITMVGWFSVLVLPAVVLGAGIFTWVRRRRS